MRAALPTQGDPDAFEAGKLPQYGTAMLCASGPREPAKAPPDLPHTMFTGCLLDVLRSGAPNAPHWLSLGDIHHHVRARLQAQFADKAVLPQIHGPQQRMGRLDVVPLFRNPAREAARPAAGHQELVAAYDIVASATEHRFEEDALASTRPEPERSRFNVRNRLLRGRRSQAVAVILGALSIGGVSFSLISYSTKLSVPAITPSRPQSAHVPIDPVITSGGDRSDVVRNVTVTTPDGSGGRMQAWSSEVILPDPGLNPSLAQHPSLGVMKARKPAEIRHNSPRSFL